MDLQTIGIALGSVVAITVPTVSNIKTQVKNLENGEYRKPIFYSLAIVLSVGSIMLLKNSTIKDFDFLNEMNNADLIITGLIFGNLLTMGVDVKSGVVNKIDDNNAAKIIMNTQQISQPIDYAGMINEVAEESVKDDELIEI